MPVYLLHFSQPFKRARHYSGMTKDLDELRRRISDHRAGRGTGLTRAAATSGLTLILARVWEDEGREREVIIKKSPLANYCPICRLEERYRLVSHPKIPQMGGAPRRVDIDRTGG